jgi:lysozyme
VKRCVHVPLHQAEFDVYVSMAYNIGAGAFCGSSIAARANASDYRGACDAILMWKRAGGYDCSTLIDGQPNKRCYGLWKDRVKDHSRCIAAQ